MFRKILLSFLISALLADCFFLYSQNPCIDGYKGIWYSSGPLHEFGYRFSGGVATYDSRYRPVAVYSPEARKTFFVYGGTTSAEDRHLLIMASYFDHKSHLVPKPVIVYDKLGVREPNDNASLSIDGNGYLWIFVSGNGRTRPGLIFKSDKPYSIAGFKLISETEMISPQPWWIRNSGFFLLFSRASAGHELYFSSSRDGIKWNDACKLAGFGGHFQVSGINGNTITTVFSYSPGGKIEKHTNLYLLQTDDMGATWHTIGKSKVDIPLSEIKNSALVKDYESEGRIVYINDLNFDSEGNPAILALLSRNPGPGPEGGPREWVVIHWRDNKWNFSKVCESGHNYDMGSLYIEKDEWRIIGPTEEGPQKDGTGGEIALWVSRDDGASWKKEKNITSKSIYNNSFVRRPVNAQKDFYAFWADGDVMKFSASHLYFTNGKCSKVRILPYDMTEDLEKPVVIK